MKTDNCYNCGRHVPVEEMMYCDCCGKRFCEQCAKKLALCECSGELAYFD